MDGAMFPDRRAALQRAREIEAEYREKARQEQEQDGFRVEEYEEQDGTRRKRVRRDDAFIGYSEGPDPTDRILLVTEHGPIRIIPRSRISSETVAKVAFVAERSGPKPHGQIDRHEPAGDEAEESAGAGADGEGDDSGDSAAGGSGDGASGGSGSGGSDGSDAAASSGIDGASKTAGDGSSSSSGDAAKTSSSAAGGGSGNGGSAGGGDAGGGGGVSGAGVLAGTIYGGRKWLAPKEGSPPVKKGDVVMIPGTMRFMIALKDQPDWDGKYTVWGKIANSYSWHVISQIPTGPTQPGPDGERLLASEARQTFKVQVRHHAS